MSKKVLGLLIFFAIGVFSFTIFPQMVSYGVGRALQYVHIVFSFILLILIFNLFGRMEKEGKERETLSSIVEKKKAEIFRTRQALTEATRTLSTILAQEGQAYLTFNREGKVSHTHSRSCLDILGCEPGNMYIEDVLKIEPSQRESFKDWIGILFDQVIDFKEAVPLGPSEFDGEDHRKISLSYRPIQNDAGEIMSILVIAQDDTAFEEVSRQAVEKAEESEVIARLIKQKESFIFFNQEFNQGLKKFLIVTREKEISLEKIRDYLRFLHGVKGGFFQIGLASLGMKVHDLEDIWGEILNRPEKYRKQLLKDLKFLQESWVKFIRKYSRIVGYSLEDSERIIEFTLSEAIDLYSKISIIAIPEKINKQFRSKITKSIGKYFEQYQDLVQEIAQKLHKEIYPMQIIGGEVRVIPEAYKDLFVSMGHLFRNSIDHGIEKPDQREYLHKDPVGKIELRFSKVRLKNKTDLLIEVIDDGKGIDPHKLRDSLLAKGDKSVIDLSDEEVMQRIFEDGISTKSDKKNLLSGRGVGVSAVKQSVEQMGGTIKVTSEVGKGCHFYIQVPFVELNLSNLDKLNLLI